jgi:hypothetical protein
MLFRKHGRIAKTEDDQIGGGNGIVHYAEKFSSAKMMVRIMHSPKGRGRCIMQFTRRQMEVLKIVPNPISEHQAMMSGRKILYSHTIKGEKISYSRSEDTDRWRQWTVTMMRRKMGLEVI